MSRQPNLHQPLPRTFDQVLMAVADEQKPQTRTVAAKPFVKWVGGKRSILGELVPRLPEHYGDYYEPFVGGGALFFSVQPDKAHLSDINLHLVLTYRAVRDNVEGLIAMLKEHETKHNKTYYLRARKKLGSETNPTAIAALLIYLNKTCYNGLYRVNKAGEYNVPMGDYANPTIVDEDTLRADSAVLKGAEIEQRNFTQIKPKKNAFYYLDPPYHETYDGYNGSGFGDEKHKELADFCKKVDETGGFFMLSNSDTPFVRSLYKGYTIEQVAASRSVSCKAHQRGKENELIIRNYDGRVARE